MGDGPVGDRVADGQVDQGRDLHRDVDHHVVVCDVLEELLEVDLLLVAGAEQLGLLHARDGQDALVVELGVVEAVEQMHAAGPGGRQAHPEPARDLRVAAGHERGGLLVVDQHEADSVLVPSQGLREAVDPVAGQPEDRVDPPVDEAFNEQLGGDLGHRESSIPQRRTGPSGPATN